MTVYRESHQTFLAHALLRTQNMMFGLDISMLKSIKGSYRFPYVIA